MEFLPDGECAFVPITAAGQRGPFTPFPHIHSVFKRVKDIEGTRLHAEALERAGVDKRETSGFKPQKQGEIWGSLRVDPRLSGFSASEMILTFLSESIRTALRQQWMQDW
jgi:hypothetical protein